MQLFIMLRTCLILLTIVSYAPIKSAEAPIPSGYLSLGNPDSRRAPILLDLSRRPLNSDKTWHEIMTKIKGPKTLVIQVATKKDGHGFGLGFFCGKGPLDAYHDNVILTKTLTSTEIQELLSQQVPAQPLYQITQGYAPAYYPPYNNPYGTNSYVAYTPSPYPPTHSYAATAPYGQPPHSHNAQYRAPGYLFPVTPYALPVSASHLTLPTKLTDPTHETIKHLQSKMALPTTNNDEKRRLQAALETLMALINPFSPSATGLPAASTQNQSPVRLAPDGSSEKDAREVEEREIARQKSDQEVAKRQREQTEREQQEKDAALQKATLERKQREEAKQKQEQIAREQRETDARKRKEKDDALKARAEKEAKKAAEQKVHRERKEEEARLAALKKQEEIEKQQKQLQEAAEQRERSRKEKQAKEETRLAELEKKVAEAEAKKAKRSQQHGQSASSKEIQKPADHSKHQSDEYSSPIAQAAESSHQSGLSKESKAEQAVILRMRKAAEKQAALETAAAAEVDRFKEIEKAYYSQNYQQASALLATCNHKSQRFVDTVILLVGTIKATKVVGSFTSLCDLVLPLTVDKEKRLSNEQKIELLLFLADHANSDMVLTHLEHAKNLGSAVGTVLFYTHLIEEHYRNPNRPRCKEGIACVHEKAAMAISTFPPQATSNMKELYQMSVRFKQVECVNLKLCSFWPIPPVNDIYKQAQKALSPADYSTLLSRTSTSNVDDDLSKTSQVVTPSKVLPAAATAAAYAAPKPKNQQLSSKFKAKFELFLTDIGIVYDKPGSAEKVKEMISVFFETEKPTEKEINFIYARLKNNLLLALFYEVFLKTQSKSDLKLLSAESFKVLSCSVAKNLLELISQLESKQDPIHQKAIVYLTQIHALAIKISHGKPGEYLVVEKTAFSSEIEAIFSTHQTLVTTTSSSSKSEVAQRLMKRKRNEGEADLLKTINALLTKVTTEKNAYLFVVALEEFESHHYYEEFRGRIDAHLRTLHGENLTVWSCYTILPSAALIKLLVAPIKRDQFTLILAAFEPLLRSYIARVGLNKHTFPIIERLFRKLFLRTSTTSDLEAVLSTFKEDRFSCCEIKALYKHLEDTNEMDKVAEMVFGVIQKFEALLETTKEQSEVTEYIKDTFQNLKAALIERTKDRVIPQLPAAAAANVRTEPAQAATASQTFSIDRILERIQNTYLSVSLSPAVLNAEENEVATQLCKAQTVSDLQSLIKRTQTEIFEAPICLNGFLKYMKNPSLAVRQHEFVALLEEFKTHFVPRLQKIIRDENVLKTFNPPHPKRDPHITEFSNPKAMQEEFEKHFNIDCEIISWYQQLLEIKIETILGLLESIHPEIIISSNEVLQETLTNEATNQFLSLIREMADAYPSLDSNEKSEAEASLCESLKDLKLKNVLFFVYALKMHGKVFLEKLHTVTEHGSGIDRKVRVLLLEQFETIRKEDKNNPPTS